MIPIRNIVLIPAIGAGRPQAGNPGGRGIAPH